MKLKLVFFGIGLLIADLTLTASPPAESLTPVVGHATRHTVSRRLSDLPTRPVPQTGASVEVPLRVTDRRAVRPDRRGVEDPLRQLLDRPFPEAALTPAPNSSFEGLSDDDNSATVGFRVVPPDTNGDIGPNHYVQYINSIFAIYDRSGVLLHGPFAGNAIWQGAGGQCEANNDGDPIVLYDQLDDRWLFSQFAINSGTQCVALSRTGDPNGPYDRWEFVVSPGENNDYPKFGLMPNAYYLSLRDFPSNDGTFASAVAFDRAAMLAGAVSPVFVKFSLPCLSNDCPDGIQPPHLEGLATTNSTPPGVFSRIWDEEFEGTSFGSDGYRLWSLVPNFASPASSTFTALPYITSAGFDSTMCGAFQRGCISQPKKGGGERLDPVDELQMYRAQYRQFPGYETLLLSTTADATGNNQAGVRWAELRNSGGGWALYQEGTYAPGDSENRWMGSIAMNGNGDIALGYSVSSSGTFPSIRYVTRMANDPLGTLPGGEVELIAGSGSQTSSSNRWGDYSAMSVDPTDDCTFWYTQEYYSNTGSFDFKTRIGSFPGPSCAPACVPNETPEVSCNDGQDNDCDGAIDCADSDCSGDPVCAVCTLGQPGDPCTDNSQCCSNNCKGKPGSQTCK